MRLSSNPREPSSKGLVNLFPLVFIFAILFNAAGRIKDAIILHSAFDNILQVDDVSNEPPVRHIPKVEINLEEDVTTVNGTVNIDFTLQNNSAQDLGWTKTFSYEDWRDWVKESNPEYRKELKTEKSWDDRATWTHVQMPDYANVVQKAQAAIRPLVQEVETQCELVVLPPGRTRRAETLADIDIQFRCSGHDANGNAEQALLQDEPCTNISLCRVVVDDQLFTEVPNAPYWFQSSNRHKSGDPTKTTLLAMVDGMAYLRVEWVMRAFLNKVTYSYATGRDFYLFIGNPTNLEELHRRNTQTVASAFGGLFCHGNYSDPALRVLLKDSNSLHYFKPIAFEALFGLGKNVVDNVLFLDADVWFNLEAFERIQTHKVVVDREDPQNFNKLQPITLEDYFLIAPRTSIMGSQNPSGKADNILINGGLIFLRRSEFTHAFSSLWWYLRCGDKDQLALWLVLYATWSAISSQMRLGIGKRHIGEDAAREMGQRFDRSGFGYPSVFYRNYAYARCGVTNHSQVHLPQLRQQWQEWSVMMMKKKVTDASISLTLPFPGSNSPLFDGGLFKTSGTFTYPMELPHVLMLPLRAFTTPDGRTFPALAQKPGNSQRNNPKGSFFTHVKYKPYDTCKDQKCWPFLDSLVEPKNTTMTRAIVAISLGRAAAKSKFVERFVWSARHNGQFKGPIVIVTDAQPDRYKGISDWTDNFITVKPKSEHQSKKHKRNTAMARKRHKTYVLDYLDRDPRLTYVKLAYYLDIDIVFGSPLAPLFEGLENEYQIGHTTTGSNQTANMWMFKGNYKKYPIQGGQLILDRATSQPCLDEWRSHMDRNRRVTMDQDLLKKMLKEEKRGGKSLKCKIVAMDQGAFIEFPEDRDVDDVSNSAVTDSTNQTPVRNYAPLVHIRNTAGVTTRTSEGNYQRYIRDVLGMTINEEDTLGITEKQLLD